MFNSALTAAIFWDLAPQWFVGPWLALVWLASLNRIYSWYRHRNRPARSKTGKRAASRATFWTTVCGIMWGGAGFVLFPYGTMVDQIFLTFVIGGMSAGVVASMSVLPNAVYGYVLTSVLPLIIRFAMGGESVSLIMAAMAAAYLVALALFTHNGNHAFRESLRFKLENRRLQVDIAATHTALADAIESSPGGLALYDADDRLIAWNGNYQSFFWPDAPGKLRAGLRFESLLRAYAKTREITNHQNAEDYIAERLARRKAPGASWETKIGDGRWVQSTERRTGSGGIVTISTDITDLKRRESDLAAKTSLLQGTLDNMDQGLIAFGPDLAILAANRRAAEILDLAPSDLAPGADFGATVRSTARRGDYGPGDHRKYVKNIRALIDRGDPLQFETTRPDGVVTEVRGSPSTGGGYVVMYKDITERKRADVALRSAKEQAEMANRMKSQFLANTSHELRTPLNAINGFSEFMLREPYGPLGDARYSEYVSNILQSSDHLLSIINDILDLSKIEAGRFELNESQVDLADVLRATTDLIGDHLKRSDVRIELAAGLGDFRLVADERAIKQIVLNLLSNAVKFTPDGGLVSIDATLDGHGNFILSVTDTGIGMAEKDKVIALSDFGQVENPLSRRFDGTGLGLPLARSLVELHGGSLEIDSEVGRGTTVRITLPPERVATSRSPVRRKRA